MTASRQPIDFVPGTDIRTAFRAMGNGPLLVLVHGAEADHTMFLDLMQALACDFRVVAYDQRDSGRTENGEALYGLAELADDAAALIGFLLEACGGTRVHLYGTSFGGQIAQVVASRHAHLVDRLILGSTWAVGRRASDMNPAAMERLARLRGQLPGSAGEIAEYFFSRAFLDARPDVIELFRGTQRTAVQAKRRAHLMQAEPPHVDFTGITAPTLLLAGGADRLVPTTETFDLARRLAQPRLQELPGLPHVAPIEAPEQVAQAIRRFLLPAPPG